VIDRPPVRSDRKKGGAYLFKNGTWNPYAGSEAIILTSALLIIAAVLAYLGTRLHRSVGVKRPGTAISIFLVGFWGLSLVNLVVAVGTYMQAFYQQFGAVTLPKNPISPITDLSVLVTFIIILYFTRHYGLKIALGSAIVGSMAAPMIFELPFDLIVITRTYSPLPATQYRLLYFLPLFLVEITTFSLLTLSPVTKLSKYTLFSLSAMFMVFAVWAVFGFSYPLYPIPIALNMLSKILSFIAAITLFLPHEENPIQ
jgi:hypothetical protein